MIHKGGLECVDKSYHLVDLLISHRLIAGQGQFLAVYLLRDGQL